MQRFQHPVSIGLTAKVHFEKEKTPHRCRVKIKKYMQKFQHPVTTGLTVKIHLERKKDPDINFNTPP